MKCTESDKSLRQQGTGTRLDSSLRGCLIRWVFYLFLFTKDGTEYLFNETGNRRDSENNQLPQFRQQAGLKSHRAGSAGDQRRQAVFGYFVPGPAISITAPLAVGETGNEIVEFRNAGRVFSRARHKVHADVALASQQPDGVIHRPLIFGIVSTDPQGPGEIVGSGIVIGRAIPSHYVKRPPSSLSPLSIRFFCSLFHALEQRIGVQLVLFVVFHISGVMKFKDHEPLGVLGFRNQGTQLIPAGDVVGQDQDLLRSFLAGKTVSLGDVDLGHIPQVAYDGTILPLNLWLLLLRLRRLWLLSGTSHPAQQRQKNEQTRNATIAKHRHPFLSRELSSLFTGMAIEDEVTFVTPDSGTLGCASASRNW